MQKSEAASSSLGLVQMGVMVHKHPGAGACAPMQVQDQNGFDGSPPAELTDAPSLSCSSLAESQAIRYLRANAGYPLRPKRWTAFLLEKPRPVLRSGCNGAFHSPRHFR